MKKIIAVLVLYILHFSLQAQGCSDAGVCTIGSMGGGGNKEDKTGFTLNTQFGMGEQNVAIFSEQFEGILRLTKSSSLQCKVPWIRTNGNLGSNSALGDISLTYGRMYFNKNNWLLRYNAGFRLAVNHADKSFKSEIIAGNTLQLSLPMPYQTGLGTNDLLLGSDAVYKNKWLFGIGFQYPLIQNNKNTFDTILLIDPKAKAYFTSYSLFRRPDLVLRLDRQFTLNKTFSINTGFITIYHLGHDRAVSLNGNSYAISGSKGLTLNFTNAISAKISKHFTLSTRFSVPLVVRRVRPDGLTRQFVLGLELRYLL